MRYEKTFFNDWKADNSLMQAAKDSAMEAADKRRNIIMVGNCGTGKTMLAHCIANSFTTSIVATASGIGRAFRDNMASGAGTEREIIDAITKDCEYLVIDEIGTYKLTDYEYRMINEIIDIRYELMLPTALVSNLDLDNLKSVLGERVIDRMRSDNGMLVAFTWESSRGK